MKIILVVALLSVLAVHMTVGHSDPTGKTCLHSHPTGKTCLLEHSHLPKIPGCCDFLKAFHAKMDALKKDHDKSCKNFTDRPQQEECKMRKILIARNYVASDLTDECKQRMQDFVQGKPTSDD
uniref:U20-Theraphotoxin-Ct1a_1 n=1 Tax=Coremiocnemis tropix TaxID=1904443 RepID=A0A482ZDE0_CORTR